MSAVDADLTAIVAAAAREMQSHGDLTSTMESVVALAVNDLDHADAAALSMCYSKTRVETPAATSRAARYADELQYEFGEGPCLDAIWEHRLIDVPDLGEEDRWPTWAPRIVEEAEFRSMMCFRLFLSEDTVGALNLYSRQPHSFGVDERDYGQAIASHIAIALRASEQISHLQLALDSRTVIAQATGVLMERSDLDSSQAFAVLANVASATGRKLRSVAEEFVVTRRLPGTPEGSGRTARDTYESTD